MPSAHDVYPHTPDVELSFKSALLGGSVSEKLGKVDKLITSIHPKLDPASPPVYPSVKSEPFLSSFLPSAELTNSGFHGAPVIDLTSSPNLLPLFSTSLPIEPSLKLETFITSPCDRSTSVIDLTYSPKYKPLSVSLLSEDENIGKLVQPRRVVTP